MNKQLIEQAIEALELTDQFSYEVWKRVCGDAAIAALRAEHDRVVEPVALSWSLKYEDSTPRLNVIHSAFEDWFQAQPFATQVGIKQMCRDSYAAGMGDPLVTYAHPSADAQNAARYRWLLSNAYVGIAPYPKPHEVWCLRLPNPAGVNNLDAAIDAAMKGKK